MRTLVMHYGCTGCHTISIFPEAGGTLAPDLSHIGSDAAQVIFSAGYKASSGQATTGSAYIRESIPEPGRFVAADCPTGPCLPHLMPPTFQQQFKSAPADLELIIKLLTSLN